MILEQQQALTKYNNLIAKADEALTKGPFTVLHKTGVPPTKTIKNDENTPEGKR